MSTAPPSTLQEDDGCSIPYFRSMVASETKRLTRLCETWEDKLEKNREIMSDVTEGEMRSVIGQGRLVMTERFAQFSGLVDNCEFKQGEKETTCMDLKGFWEMIYFQVVDVDCKFAELEKVEANNWVEVVVEQPAVTKKHPVGVARKRAAVVVKKVASAGLKALIAAKRRKAGVVEERGAEGNGKETTNEIEALNIIVDKASDENACLISPEKTFDGGFFSIKSPCQLAKSPTKRVTQSTGCDRLRKSVLTESAKRVSGLVSPFVSQVARRALRNGEKQSPEKDSRRSSLFDDFDQENEVLEDADSNSPVEEQDVFQVAAIRL
eukprot:GFUD01031807.1.p1 GENE.GFUD01031807.1~~GFUD01031807.1.p1  ORF type:complete len:323 (+),score=110.93 GFUD01031807.1:86-1054(+)